MADVRMPKSIPCKFKIAWSGKCGKPSTNGWCSKHERSKCAAGCGRKAVRSCGETSGPFCCGANLCNSCKHSVRIPGELPGPDHVSAEVYKVQREKEDRLKKEDRESDESLLARGVPLGLPRHLKELQVGDQTGYKLAPIFLLELDHTLMGFFPAEVKGTKRILMSTDRLLMFKVWRSLEPQKSKMTTVQSYVNEELGICYPINGSSDYELKSSRPHRLLSEAELESFLKVKDSLKWASGLFGADCSQDDFEWIIEHAMRKASEELHEA